MKYFIIATRKVSGKESEITHYGYNLDASNEYYLTSKEDFWSKVQTTYKSDLFYSFDVKNNTKVLCDWRQNTVGQPFLQSDPNGTEKDNLLELPDC